MNDRAASVLARLRNKARESGKPFQLCLQLFCQEEFLRRLSISPYAGKLILKGGLFIYTLTRFESRATIDIDFLLRDFPNRPDDVRRVIDEIVACDTGNDFIVFETGGLEAITPQREYAGVSARIVARIANTRTPFAVDFGVGDVIVPGSEIRKIPTQLEDFSAPIVCTYSLESTIAEKLDAMVSRLELTSRMKDFYDIWYLSQTFAFDGTILLKAVKDTLENRGTSWTRDTFAVILSFADNRDMLRKWGFFLRRLGLEKLDFKTVLDGIESFLSPVWSAFTDGAELHASWNPSLGIWSSGDRED
jgi:predicted nucleotidyltransferase component of viral defense system